MTIDDNEVHRARQILDEIYGDENFIATVIWQKKYSTKSDTRFLSEEHEYILVYARQIGLFTLEGLERSEAQDAHYKNPDNDPRGDWASDNLLRTEVRDYAIFEIPGPTGVQHLPPKGSSWRFTRDRIEKLLNDNRIWFGADGRSRPRLKRFLSEVRDSVPAQTIWKFSDVGHSDSAKKALALIFVDEEAPFSTPKSVPLVQRVLRLIGNKTALVLDSFAGSATTAHAVLTQNAQDSGNRRFILVECEDYADELTAERVRRVINGYEFQGTQKEELLRQKVSFTEFKKSAVWLQKIESVENLEGHRFDNVKKEIKNGELLVTGEKKVTERAAGLGGDFTFYTLGEPLDIDKILTGESLPDYQNIGGWLFHTATGETLDERQVDEKTWYLGQSSAYHVWLIYKPDLDFLKSRDAALTLQLAQEISETHKDKSHLVFAPAKFVPNKMILPLAVEYAPLPFALYRFEKD
jgi:adenine-specific DNA-methyltransferase